MAEPGVCGLLFKFEEEELLMTAMFAHEEAFLKSYCEFLLSFICSSNLGLKGMSSLL